ncbi:hypothetical protein GCM10007079_09120 [Nocardiopsis terrae]|uniref:Membrane protein YeiB n=1 Tax=Nocardiopsis terrae TaxID=372655 RepID=A0ABR9HCX4_9ACTN|nr:DUF418 domain-containing protein [Nocardiopsis terrae]MBE1456872.1 putative membrane protein YeiB [Nocardiopsis terrae]GHC74683.1 hypothetical protein GCM10007079_09120 [Nocardiopsis terrae]
MTGHDHSPRPGERALAPDLARGIMLLFIALANVSWYLYGAPTSAASAHRADATGPDALWQSVSIVAVDGRSYPLFAFLFGYGIWQAYTRRRTAGQDEADARRSLQSRHLWLLAFGAVHAALLWQGDVLGAYGLIGLIVTGLFLRRSNRTLAVWALVLGGLLGLLSVLTLVAGAAAPATGAAVSEGAVPQFAAVTPYADSILVRLRMWPLLTVGQGVLGLVVPVAVLTAILCARHRILESPERHRPLLSAVAVAGVTAGWLGAVPSVLVQQGSWDVPVWTPLMFNGLTGLFAAFGYVALIALLAARLSAARAHRGPVRALSALGRRSLSGYLLQSVLFAPLLCAWGLGLGGVLAQWQAVLVAVAVWLFTLVLAAVLDHAGRPGPAERLLRALVHRDRRPRGAPVAS